MRLTSEFVVGALVRRVQAEGAYATVAHHGDDTAGAIFVLVDGLDGEVSLFGPAPPTYGSEDEHQAVSDDAALTGNRLFAAIPLVPEPTRAAAETVIERERNFDRDIWVIDIEDRQKRSFVPVVKSDVA